MLRVPEQDSEMAPPALDANPANGLAPLTPKEQTELLRLRGEVGPLDTKWPGITQSNCATGRGGAPLASAATINKPARLPNPTSSMSAFSLCWKKLSLRPN